MSEVVSFTKYKKDKEVTENVARELDNIFQATDQVLDVLQENFDEGISIGILDGQLQVASTFDDYDLMVAMLEDALYQVKNEY